jgi:diaminobutyrate-2-oxoglutarate transaminase
MESNVRYYCRRWPTVFAYGNGATLRDERGREYIDFFSGAGALSYGHSAEGLVEAMVRHLREGRLIHSLDMYTPEKREFLEVFQDLVLSPRGLRYVSQFVGPTGATAVEAALRLAYLATGRTGVVSFDGGYHGMTARTREVSGALAESRSFVGAPDGIMLPYVAHTTTVDLERVDAALQGRDVHGRPGALIIETVQGEGGVRPFPDDYLAALRRLCTEHGVILVADEVQIGVGRTGPFFSFEPTDLDPDIVCLSKAISGSGLPLAFNLVKPDFDLWEPGEFTGTFRGSNLALATATAMLKAFWAGGDFQEAVTAKGLRVTAMLGEAVQRLPDVPMRIRGRGLIHGVEFPDGDWARCVADEAFRQGLLVETCGVGSATVKLLPPLTIEPAQLSEGVLVLEAAMQKVAA